MVEVPKHLFRKIVVLLTWALDTASIEKDVTEEDLEYANQFAQLGGFLILKNNGGVDFWEAE